jgi:hypothetical protein
VLIVSIAVVAGQAFPLGMDIRKWDWMFVSGFATWLAGVYFPLLLPDKLTETLTRLVNRGVLNGDEDFSAFLMRLHQKARRTALIGAVVFCVAMATAWSVAFFAHPVGDYAFALVYETIATIPVGLFAGRALSYGLLGQRLLGKHLLGLLGQRLLGKHLLGLLGQRLLGKHLLGQRLLGKHLLGLLGQRLAKKERFTLTCNPYHLDGAAGLRPIGAFYLYQSGLLAIPGVFLAVWWFLIPTIHIHNYHLWQEPYAGLLLVVVVFQIFAFVLPMLSFHRLMLRCKNQLLREADELSRRSAQKWPDPAIHEIWKKRYALIESMPTWPMDLQIRRRFGLRNILLLVPPVAQVLGAAPRIQSLLGSIHKLLSG